MTIGIVSSKICQIPSMHSIVMVPLMNIAIKNHNIPQKRLDEQQQIHWEALNMILWWVFHRLTSDANPSAGSRYYNVPCADGNYTHCTTVLEALVSDFPQYSKLCHLEWHVSFWHECPKSKLGDYVPPNKQHPHQDHKLYITLSNANTMAADAKCSSCHVHWVFNMFRHIPCKVRDHQMTDYRYILQISMIDHLQTWIFHLLTTHTQGDKYNALCLSVRAYHDLTPKHKLFEHCSQWNGKEMPEMSRYLHRVVTQTVRGLSPAQHPTLNHVIKFTPVLLQFDMYAWYKSQDDATLSYMEDAMQHFHTFKEDFLLGQAGIKEMAKANALRTEPMTKRNIEKETNLKASMALKKWREMNACHDFITYEIDYPKESDADFMFLQIHMMSHWVKYICWYGALPQYSVKRHEEAYITNLQNSWTASNHNLNNLPQAVTFQCHIVCFAIREPNLYTLTQCQEKCAAEYTVLPSGADLPAPLSSQ